MNKLEIIKQESFKKAFRKLLKRYKSIDRDLDNFFDSITSKKDLGIELKANLFKVRIANSDKQKGKSSGYRLISYLKILDDELHLIYIYDKSDLENIDEKEIDKLILKSIF